MRPTARIAFSLALLVLATPPAAPAQDRGRATSDVIDDAGMFSRDAVRRAKSTLEEADRGRDVVVTVETVESLRGQEVGEVAIRRAERVGHKGIFILIAKQERKLDVLASPRSLREELGRDRLTAITKAFADEFRRGSPDDGLIQGTKAASAALGEVRRLPVPVGPASSGSPPTSAAPGSLFNRQQVALTLMGARKAVEGAEAAAAKAGRKVSIAVVDAGGHLLSLDRMDGAAPASAASATAKAHSAATHRAPTRSDSEPASKARTVFGGIPIALGDEVIGAIGVAGADGEQDDKIAEAGLAYLVADPNIPAPSDAPKPRGADEAPRPREKEGEKKEKEGEKIDITIPRPDEVGKLKPAGDDPR